MDPGSKIRLPDQFQSRLLPIRITTNCYGAPDRRGVTPPRKPTNLLQKQNRPLGSVDLICISLYLQTMISRSRASTDVQTLTEQVSVSGGMFHVLMIVRGRVFAQYAALLARDLRRKLKRPESGGQLFTVSTACVSRPLPPPFNFGPGRHRDAG